MRDAMSSVLHVVTDSRIHIYVADMKLFLTGISPRVLAVTQGVKEGKSKLEVSNVYSRKQLTWFCDRRTCSSRE